MIKSPPRYDLNICGIVFFDEIREKKSKILELLITILLFVIHFTYTP